MKKPSPKQIDLLFRVGLAGLFLANGIGAIVSPDDFKDPISANALASHIASAGTLVHVIPVNDIALAAFILLGKWRKVIAIWAVLWLLAVIYVTGFWTTDLIEHVGDLALVGYFYLSAKS